LGHLKSAKQILEDMGFRKESKESTQLAFLRHLKKDMIQQRVETLPSSQEPVQLEFELGDSNGPRSGSSQEILKKVSNT